MTPIRVAPPRLLSVADCRAALGISQTMIYQLFKSGQLRSVQIGNRRLVPVEALDQYVATLTPASSEEEPDA